MAEWTTGAAILAQAGAAASPSAADTAWAELCAGAVNAAVDLRLEGALYISPPLPPELVRAALTAGVQAFKAREANLDAEAPAVVGDYIPAIEPIIGRYATRGIA